MLFFYFFVSVICSRSLRVAAFVPTVESAEEPLVPPVQGKHCLLFEDHFNHLDMKKWQHEITLSGGGNWEFQWYTNNRSNSFVEDGILYIKPTLTSNFIGEEQVKNGGKISLWSGEPSVSCTDNSNFGCERVSGGSSGGDYLNPIQSAQIRTIHSMSLRYGKIEVRARLPVGDWLRPAIWMMPKDSTYGSWPASGEIDIMESRGNKEYEHGNTSAVSSSLHWGPSSLLDRFNLTHAEALLLGNATFADDFHTFGFEWQAEGMRTFVDDQTVLRVDFDQSFWDRGDFPEWSMNPWFNGDIGAPFDQEFYLVLDVAAGGNDGFFPDTANKPWSDNDPHSVNKFWDNRDQWLPTWGKGNKRAMAVDWVKVWSADTDC